MKVSVLATSSAGNSTFVSSGGSRLLVDCGLSVSETSSRLKSIDEDVDTVTAVLLSHSHSDHAGGLPGLIRHWRRAGQFVPVYCSQATFDALPGAIPAYWHRRIAQHEAWTVGAIRCETFLVQHDCGEPLGFTCQGDNTRASFALDLGAISAALGEYLAGSDALLLESNHDSSMLRAGPYSYKLKQRIAETHLSNEAACRWIAEHMTARTKHLMLGHLSTTTNDPELVELLARQALKKRDLSTALEVIVPGAAPSGPLVLG